MVTPSIGMNGTTSVAPTRGCAPVCFVQIDQLHRFARAAEGRFRHGVRFAGQRDHAAVVIGVHLAIEHIHTRDAAHCERLRSTFAGSRPSEKFGTHSISRFIAEVSLASHQDHNRRILCFPGHWSDREEVLYAGTRHRADYFGGLINGTRQGYILSPAGGIGKSLLTLATQVSSVLVSPADAGVLFLLLGLRITFHKLHYLPTENTIATIQSTDEYADSIKAEAERPEKESGTAKTNSARSTP